MQSPCIFVVAGPNGAGKSTTAPSLLRDRFHLQKYLNADTIAAGISAFEPDHIPDEVVRRRFERGLSNFFRLYQPLVDRWIFSDNGGLKAKLLAHGGIDLVTVEKSPVYGILKEQYGSR